MPKTQVARFLDVWYPSAQRAVVAFFLFLALLIILLASPAEGHDLTGLAQKRQAMPNVQLAKRCHP